MANRLAPQSRDGRALRVLAVGNTPDVAGLARVVGCDVREARDGAEALAAAREEAPRVVFLDAALAGAALVAEDLDRELADRPAILVAVSDGAAEVDGKALAEAGVVLHVCLPGDLGHVQTLLLRLAAE